MYKMLYDFYTFSFLLCGLVTFGFILKTLWYKYTSKYDSIYCPSNLPIIGSVLDIESDSLKVHSQRQENDRKGNHVFMLWMGWLPLIFSSKPEHIKAVLGGSTHLSKSYLYFVLHDWLNTGLLTSFGEKWKKRRNLLTPAYHFSILNEFVPVFEKQAKNLVKDFMSAAEEDKIIDVQTPLSLMTLEAMCETSLGINNDECSNHRDYVKVIGTLGEQLRKRVFTPWLWPSSIYAMTSAGKKFYNSLMCVHDYTINAINKRISMKADTDKIEETNQKSTPVAEKGIYGKRKICLIDTLLSSFQKDEIDIAGIREEIDTFIFEGHDTTSSGLSFCLYQLGIHTNYQKLLQKEIDATKGKDVLEIIQKMELLDAVIKECFRLYPPVPVIGRNIEKDEIIDGVKFYKGTTFVINIFCLHRNEEHWNEPLKFDPYRFLNDEYHQRNPYCYVPFSAGPRNCIGQKFALLEVKICLYYVLKTFDLISIQKEEELELCTDMVTLSRNGVLMKFKERV